MGVRIKLGPSRTYKTRFSAPGKSPSTFSCRGCSAVLVKVSGKIRALEIGIRRIAPTLLLI